MEQRLLAVTGHNLQAGTTHAPPEITASSGRATTSRLLGRLNGAIKLAVDRFTLGTIRRREGEREG